MNTNEHLERLLDEVVRLLAVQARLQMETQNEAIIAFAEAGFGPKRIAELLGTTANTVNVGLSKARKTKKQPRTVTGAHRR